jgi:hypothetical protein
MVVLKNRFPSWYRDHSLRYGTDVRDDTCTIIKFFYKLSFRELVRHKGLQIFSKRLLSHHKTWGKTVVASMKSTGASVVP